MTDQESMYGLVCRLFPICRSLTGEGVRQTLRIIQEHLPDLTIHEVRTGTECYDWQVPQEWNITSARLTGPDGEVIADFKDTNIHVVGYSEPVDQELDFEELQDHLFSLPNQPDAIPYITSYYKRTWGFCITDRQRKKLKPGKYHAKIDSSFTQGNLTYGELIIPGESKEEIFLSTYVCHPSMANNELSGPVVTTWLAKYLQSLPRRHYTYRIIFIPETIGSILYLSRHLEHLKQHVKAGFTISCVGDDRTYSYLPSRLGGTLADKVATHVLAHHYPQYQRYTYLQRGSDERNYCWPGVDLPMCSVMRSKYATYPEYHTSLDNLDLVSEAGLHGAYEALRLCLECLEQNHIYHTTSIGEPQLGKRNLYPTLSRKKTYPQARMLVDILAYSDGNHDVIDIANMLGKPAWELHETFDTLLSNGLLRHHTPPAT
jgi:aminopeptidase-like protein